MQYHQPPFNFPNNTNSDNNNNNLPSDPSRSRPNPPTEPPGLTSMNPKFPPPTTTATTTTRGLRSAHHPLNFILPGSTTITAPQGGRGSHPREDSTGKPIKKHRPNRKSFLINQEPSSGMTTSSTPHPNGRVPNLELIATLTRNHPPGGSSREPTYPRPSEESDHQNQPNGLPEDPHKNHQQQRDTLTPLPNLNQTKSMEPNYIKLGESHQTTTSTSTNTSTNTNTNGSNPHRTSNHKRKGSFKGSFKIPPSAIPPFTQLGVDFPKFQPSHRKRNSESINHRKFPPFHRGHTQSLDKNPFPLNGNLPRPRELPNHPPTQVTRPPPPPPESKSKSNPKPKSESKPLGHAFASKKVGNKEVFVFSLPPQPSNPEWDSLDSPRKDSTSSSHSSTTRDITELQHIWTSHTTPGSVASAKGVHTRPIPRTRCLSGPGKLHAWQSLHGPEVSPRFNTPLYPYLEPSAPHPTQLGRSPRLDKNRPKFERVQNWLSNQPKGPHPDSGNFTGVHPPTPTKSHFGAGTYHVTSGETMVSSPRGPPDTPSDPQLGQDSEVYIGDFFNSPGPNLELLMDSPVPAAAELVAISHQRQRLQSGNGNRSTSSPVPVRRPPSHSSDGSHPDPSPGPHRVSTSHPQEKRPPPAMKAPRPPTPESNDHVVPRMDSHPPPRGEETQVPPNPSELPGQPKKPSIFTHRKSYTPRPPTPEGDPTAEPTPASLPSRKSPPFQSRPLTPELDQVVPDVVRPPTVVQPSQPRPSTPEKEPQLVNPPAIPPSPKSHPFAPRPPSPEPASSLPIQEVTTTTPTTPPPRQPVPFQARPLTPEEAESKPIEKLLHRSEPSQVRPPTPEGGEVINSAETPRDLSEKKAPKVPQLTGTSKVRPPTPEEGGETLVGKSSGKPEKKSKGSQPSQPKESFKVRPPTPEEGGENLAGKSNVKPEKKTSQPMKPFKARPPTPEEEGETLVDKSRDQAGKKPPKVSHPTGSFPVRPPTPEEDLPVNPTSQGIKSKVRPPTPEDETTHSSTMIPGDGIEPKPQPSQQVTTTPPHGKRSKSVAPPHHQKKGVDVHDLAIPDQNISPLILNETHHHTTPASPPGSMTLPSQPTTDTTAPTTTTNSEVKIKTKLRYTGQEFVPRGLPRPSTTASYLSGSSSPAGHLSPPSDSGSYGANFYPLSPGYHHHPQHHPGYYPGYPQGYPQGYQNRLPTSPPTSFPPRSPSYHGSPPGNRQQLPSHHPKSKFTNGHRNKGSRPNDHRRREETPPGSPTQFTLTDFPPLGSPSEALKPTRVAHPSPRSKATKIKYTTFDQHVDHLVHQATSHPNAPTHYRYPGTGSPRPTQSQPGGRSPSEVHPSPPRRPQTDPDQRKAYQPPISEKKTTPIHPTPEVNPGVEPRPPTQSSVKDEITRSVPKGVTPTHPESNRDETTLGLGLDFRSSPPAPELPNPHHPGEKGEEGHREEVHPQKVTEKVEEKLARVSDQKVSTEEVPRDERPPHDNPKSNQEPIVTSTEDPVASSEFAEVVTVWDSPPDPDLKFTIELPPPPTLPSTHDDREVPVPDVTTVVPPMKNGEEPVKKVKVSEPLKVEEVTLKGPEVAKVEPVKMKEVPTEAKDVPTTIKEKPVKMKEVSTKVKEEPTKTKNQAVKIKEHVEVKKELVKIEEEPVKVKDDSMKMKEELVKVKEPEKTKEDSMKEEPAKAVKSRVTKLEVEVDRFDFLNLREPQEFNHLEGDYLSPTLNPWVTQEEHVKVPTTTTSPPAPPSSEWKDPPTRSDPGWGLAIAVSGSDQNKQEEEVVTPTPSPPPVPPTLQVLARHCFDTPCGPRKLIWYRGTHPWETVATFCQRYHITNPKYLQALVHYVLHPPNSLSPTQ